MHRHVILKHLTPLPLLMAFAACCPQATAPTAEPAEQPAPMPEFRDLPGQNRYVMVIPVNLPPDQWKQVAKDKCGAVEFCQIYGWSDPTEAPQAFPMTDREVETQAFSYGINRATGFERATWKCGDIEREAPEDCI
jgi:hypothetical protein